MKLKSTLIGTKEFYRKVFAIVVPMIIQNTITNVVSLLDNVMVGRVGTLQMSAVTIVNQLMFVFYLCIFGGMAGAGIFLTQFAGAGDNNGIRYCIRIKAIVGAVMTALAIGVFLIFKQPLIEIYIAKDTLPADAAATIKYAADYMQVMLIGLLPFAAMQVYASTLRETGETKLPMVASIAAILVNLVFNYILIFGHFGAPALGVKGAAIATVLSRYVELLVVALATHLRPKKYPFMKGVFSSLYVPRELAQKLFLKALPLMINETLWSAGVAAVNIQYSVKGLDAIAALNISQTFWNVFAVAYMAVGAAIAVIIGQLLGANRLKEAKQTSYKLITASFLICVFFCTIFFIVAEFIPMAYNTESQIREIATRLMQISALAMPFDAICHATYFALRSGGKMMITFIFDCGFMWCASVLAAFLLCHFTTLPFLLIYTLVQAITIGKAALAIYLIRQDFWVKNIITE